MEERALVYFGIVNAGKITFENLHGYLRSLYPDEILYPFVNLKTTVSVLYKEGFISIKKPSGGRYNKHSVFVIDPNSLITPKLKKPKASEISVTTQTIDPHSQYQPLD